MARSRASRVTLDASEGASGSPGPTRYAGSHTPRAARPLRRRLPPACHRFRSPGSAESVATRMALNRMDLSYKMDLLRILARAEAAFHALDELPTQDGARCSRCAGAREVAKRWPRPIGRPPGRGRTGGAWQRRRSSLGASCRLIWGHGSPCHGAPWPDWGDAGRGSLDQYRTW